MKKLILVLILTVGCISSQKKSLGFKDTSEGIEKPLNYSGILDKWTDEDKAYQSLSIAFQVTATLISNPVLESQLLVDADQFKWSANKYKEERDKALATSQSETQVFVSLYTEKDENNNLDKSNADWNIFLDVEGRRILPTSIRRVFLNRAMLFNKYPYHTVWNRAYIVRFPVPVSSVSNQKVSLTLAGSLGATRLTYPR